VEIRQQGGGAGAAQEWLPAPPNYWAPLIYRWVGPHVRAKQRPVFFAAHSEDFASGRTDPVTRHWLAHPAGRGSHVLDPAEWREMRKQSDLLIKDWIQDAMRRTEVTVVLIGKETFARRWVRYEILRTLERGAGLLGVYLPPDPRDPGAPRPENPLDQLSFRIDYERQALFVWEWSRPEHRWVAPEDFTSIPLARIRYPIERAEGLLSAEFFTYDSVIRKGVDCRASKPAKGPRRGQEEGGGRA